MDARKRIVVIGGGYAGVEALKILHKKFKKDKNVELTLIDRNFYHTLMTELHEVAGSRVHPSSVQISFKRIFSGSSVKLVNDTVKEIDFTAKTVRATVASYSYDYLLITAGGDPEFFGIDGVQQNSFSLWSLEDALRIREHVEQCFRKAACEADPQKRRSLLAFVVAGAGFTGIELAGELLERRRVLCRQYHIDEKEVRVIIVEAIGKVLSILSEKLRAKTEQYLKRMGAEVMLNAPIFKAEPGSLTIEGGQRIETQTLVWTCGIHGSELTARLGLTKGQESRGECSFASLEEGIHGMMGCRFDEDEQYIVGRRGRILVNERMQSVDHQNVYLAGDIIWFLEDKKVLPQIVETALQTAHTAAHNLIADIAGGEKIKHKSNYHGFMVSIGSHNAVSNAGGMELSGFPAMALKHLINLHYLFGLAGFNAVWGYLQHEFFQMRDGRSFIGSHASAKVPLYWTVPLRLFLGAKWLIEGVKKVLEGWLDPGQGGIFDVWTKNIKIPGVSFPDAGTAASAAAAPAEAAAQAAAQAAPQAAADAATAASEAAEGAVEAVEQAVEAVTAASNAAAGAAAGNWPEPLVGKDSFVYQAYEWFAQNVISLHPTIAFLMQVSVVGAEIAIGLALISGTFTFLASAASIGLGLMFIASAMGGQEILWYIAGAIVMLGGGGRAFGLDHWLMPWIHDKWNGCGIAKKTYLYSGEPRP